MNDPTQMRVIDVPAQRKHAQDEIARHTADLAKRPISTKTPVRCDKCGQVKNADPFGSGMKDSIKVLEGFVHVLDSTADEIETPQTAVTSADDINASRQAITQNIQDAAAIRANVITAKAQCEVTGDKTIPVQQQDGTIEQVSVDDYEVQQEVQAQAREAAAAAHAARIEELTAAT